MGAVCGCCDEARDYKAEIDALNEYVRNTNPDTIAMLEQKIEDQVT